MFKFKVLVVDDDVKIRSIYREVLEIEGFNIYEASNWPECLELILRHKDFDLVLLDIQMPEVDGTVVYDVLRLHDPRIRVIISSVYPLDEQKRLIIKADDYFDKSMGTDLLIQKVKQALALSFVEKKL